MTSVDKYREYGSSFFTADPPQYVAGLAFMGCEGSREAYQLPFTLPLNSRSLRSLRCLAYRFEGTLDFTPNLCIRLSNQDEPLLEICDGQTVSYVLVPAACNFKAFLLQSTFEALMFGHVAKDDL